MKALEFAIKMEMDGEKYYSEQAAIQHGNGLSTVFLKLAKDEKNHAQILTSKSKGLAYELDESALLPAKSVFRGMADYKSKVKEVPDQVDLYDVALDMEKKSIELYTKLLSEATEDRELFEYLIKQEQGHLAIVEEIIKLVNRPNAWVEAAEFGEREEY